jgi:predicted nuclease of predicted toxin-antitoxin system
LTGHGHESNHVEAISLDEASDVEVWNWIVLRNWVLISKDEDFLHLANRQGDKGRLLWVRIGNCRKQTLLRAFDAQLSQLITAFDDGNRVVEIR